VVDAICKAIPARELSDWEFLGDIFEHLGRTDEARQAYEPPLPCSLRTS